jgi:glyoxylase-like metal-dependent hydrolase (beta-lactamase superfamily II)
VKVHHLNCGTMRPPGVPELCCHVLLCEARDGLVLVDTGFGLRDVADPAARLGAVRHTIRPVLDPEETAARQVERLGFSRDDVRHVVVTHFDVDHVGGLADFPAARVHVTAAEAHGAVHHPSRRERLRYRAAQWGHQPWLVEHRPDGEAWRGFAAAKPLTEIDEGVVLVSLPGHSRGHAAVAVDAGDHWVLHAGDAFYHHGQLDGRSRPARPVAAMETLVAFDRRQVRDNHRRLAELHRRGEPDLRIVCSHDPALLP